MAMTKKKSVQPEDCYSEGQTILRTARRQVGDAWRLVSEAQLLLLKSANKAPRST